MQQSYDRYIEFSIILDLDVQLIEHVIDLLIFYQLDLYFCEEWG